MRTMEYVEIRNPFAPALAVEHRTACRAKPDCVGEAEEGAVGVDRALETGNSAIYAEYIREMALPKGWALKSPSASRSDRTTKGSMGNVTISSSAEMRIAPRPEYEVVNAGGFRARVSRSGLGNPGYRCVR
jgi:hypothetical protein